jgi:SNF2 family DNA or RNA helicase
MRDEKYSIKSLMLINKYLVKWKALPYDAATWEPKLDEPEFERALVRYQKLQNINYAPQKDIRPNPKNFEMLLTQPDYLTGQLKGYQMDGLNWLLGNWCARTGCVLADEMGLGKTVQLIAFLTVLYSEYARFPFLVVAPNSTLDNWMVNRKRHCRI